MSGPADFLEGYYADMQSLADWQPVQKGMGYPEQVAGASDYVCSADRCGTVADMVRGVREAGVEGVVQAGGARRSRSRRHKRARRSRRKQSRRVRRSRNRRAH
jgi:hypothetical protein